MTNYDKKETKVIDSITKALEKLDKDVEKLDAIEQDSKKHSIKKWFLEKRALHEIKRVLHQADLYEKYDAKEMNEFEEYVESLDI